MRSIAERAFEGGGAETAIGIINKKRKTRGGQSSWTSYFRYEKEMDFTREKRLDRKASAAAHCRDRSIQLGMYTGHCCMPLSMLDIAYTTGEKTLCKKKLLSISQYSGCTKHTQSIRPI